MRDLRDSTAKVVAALRGGQVMAPTARRSPWVPSARRRSIPPADAGLLADLADVQGAIIEE